MDDNSRRRYDLSADPSDDKPKQQKNIRELQKKKANRRWVATAFLLSFFITAALSYLSTVMESLSIIISAIVLLIFIFIGVIFDMIGIAVTTSEIKPFNSMAARRIKTGKKAVWLISNAEKVSSVCNDLVGDIAGVVSGATGAAIAARVFTGAGLTWGNLLLTSAIAAATVGLKAVGKRLAMENNIKIVQMTARVLCGFRK